MSGKPEVTPYEHGIIAGLAQEWGNPYLPDGWRGDGYAMPYDAQRFHDGRELGRSMREVFDSIRALDNPTPAR